LYTELLVKLQQSVGDKVKAVSMAIGELDLYCGMYRAADDNCYCRPEPIDDDDTGSCLDATRLRHPLVEREHAYIPQTLKLGQRYGQCGMLLYGVNQTGKSCTMKSVGVAVVMAQSGLFVPAERFVFCPYQLLTTRILGNDNISRGLSTFAVEMIELRSILTRCNKHSLNLGDEVCHGTESASAVALVAASIRHMSKTTASFIFATHLHELSKMSEVVNLENVKHYHLTIDFDGDQIIYNRMMLAGSGLGLYGIEVARHLKLPPDILEDAYTIRNKYFSNTETAKITEMRTSRYNNKTVVSVCKVPGCKSKATQTHHIRHQAAGKSIEGMHKNNPDNLVPICDYHHDMTHGHADKDQVLVIFGYGPDGILNCKRRRKIDSLL
jgi:DNA mismatch repair protein MutS